MIGKKAVLNFYDAWPEIIGTALLVVGFFIALASGSAVISYIVIFLSGSFFGRLWYKFKKQLKFPLLIIIIGYLIGFTIGDFYGDTRILVILYIIGIVLTYYLHDTGIIHSKEY